MHFVQVVAANDVIKLTHHLTRAERAQRPTGFARWTSRKLRCDGSKVLAAFGLIFQIGADFFGFNENVSERLLVAAIGAAASSWVW